MREEKEYKLKAVKRKMLKFTAVILSVLMVIVSLPVNAFAISVNNGSPEPYDDGETLYPDETESGIEAVEIPELRGESVKYFRLSDGTYVVAQYECPVHYLDENNEWQDIDNTIIESGNEYCTSNSKIKFAKKITGNGRIFTLHDGKYKLSVALDGAYKKVTGEIIGSEEMDSENISAQNSDWLGKQMTLDKLTSSVLYSEILSGTDIEYVLQSNNIKENIIIKDKGEEYSYTFELALENMEAETTADGEIILGDDNSGEVKYIIPAPIMWDANGEFSDALEMTFSEIGSGRYTLVITADSEWVNAEGRAFPVTIDPPIYSNSGSDITDVYVYSGTPSTQCVDNTQLRVSGAYRSYWKLSALPEIPASAYIVEAEFFAKCYNSSAVSGYVGAYKVTSEWDTTMTWNDTETSATDPMGLIAADYTDYQYINYTSGTGFNNEDGIYSWNITPIVREWYDSPDTNYGIALSQVSGTSFTGYARIYSSGISSSASKPCLCISYRDMKGVEDYWSVSSQSAGFAGTGYINNANGNLTYVIGTLTTTDSLMPITVSLVYNTALAGKDYTYANAKVPTASDCTPCGFKLNIQETLLKESYTAKTGLTEYLFIWSDGDGTEHYFMPTETEGTYEDEDGLMLTLLEGTETCTISDSKHNVRTFSKYSTQPTGVVSGWYLSSIADKNSNKVEFGFDTQNRPNSVSLVPNGAAAIEQMKIAYDNNGNPYLFLNEASDEAVVIRYSATARGSITTSGGNYLRQVIRAHSENDALQGDWRAFYDANSNDNTDDVIVDAVADYTYNATGYLTAVVNNLSQYKLEYRYNTAKKIITVKEWSTSESGTSGQQISITYSEGSTVIRTSGTDDQIGNTDDLYTTYVFDSYGRPVTCYTTDYSRTVLYGASSGEYVGEENEHAKNNLKSSVQTTCDAINYIVNGGFEISGSNIPYWNKTGNAIVDVDMAYEGDRYVSLGIETSDTTSDTTSNTTSSVSQTVYLEAGEYNLSMMLSSATAGDGIIATVTATSDVSSHNVIENIPLSGSAAGGGYRIFSIPITAEPTVEGGRERFTITIQASGTSEDGLALYVDNVMLSKTIGCAEYNMVNNGGFEGSAETAASSRFWYSTESGYSLELETDGTLFGHVLKIDREITDAGEVAQTIYEAAEPYVFDSSSVADVDLYTVSGWAKGTAQAYGQSSKFGIKLTVTYYNGSETTDYEYEYEFDRSVTEWQYISAAFESDPENGVIVKVTVSLMYNGHPGTGYFDGISVIHDSKTSHCFVYNDDGRLSRSHNGDELTWYWYDSNGNITRRLTTENTYADYAYDENNNLIREYFSRYKNGTIDATTGNLSDGTEITRLYYNRYIYNVYGLVVTEQTVDNSDTSKMYVTTYAYDTDAGSHIFGAVLRQTDSLGKITQYFYDSNDGKLLATIAPDGSGTCYEYDGTDRLTQVLPAEVSTSGEYSEVATSANVSYSYDAANRLSSVTTDSTTYNFVYDVFGNREEIKVGSTVLAEYEYNANNGKLNTLYYGNGLSVKYVYDSLDRISEIQYNTGTDGAYETVYSYTYNTNGSLHSITDHRENRETVYRYNTDGKLVKTVEYDKSNASDPLILYSFEVVYDELSRVSKIYSSIDYLCSENDISDEMRTVYEYGGDGNISSMYQYGDALRCTISPVYDNLGRTTSKTVSFTGTSGGSFVIDQSYSYVSNGNNQSVLVSQYTNTISNSTNSNISTNVYNYTYDDNGNITQISNASGVIQNKYYYDDLGQLVREDNRAKNASYTWTYDNAGNILNQKTYAFTTGTLGTVKYTSSYTYGNANWGDLLTSYNGVDIEYDTIGNPTTIGGTNGTVLTWEGRRLLNYNMVDYEYSVSYTYNSDGIRIGKNSNGEVHEYILDGTNIIADKWTSDDVSYIIVYLYDELGAPIGFKYRTSSYAEGVYDCYYYEKNLQGDVIGIYNASGTKICTYVYDAWGYCTTTVTSGVTITERQIANRLSLFRYRGYVYDAETGLYYLQSRYYNPIFGRFLNADGQLNGGLLGYNMFAYCGNNPIMYVDFSGCCYFGPDGVWRHDRWEYMGNYERKESPVIAKYTASNGYLVIIVNRTFSASFYSLQSQFLRNEKIIFVIDERCFDENCDESCDPNIKIIDSYKISNYQDMSSIMDVIVLYDSQYPSHHEWGRGKEEAIKEWDIHNVAYGLGFAQSSTKDVDIDKNDKNKGYIEFLFDYFFGRYKGD